MSTATDTVHGRIDYALRVTPKTLLGGVVLAALIGTVLLFVQEPAVHDAMHNFRHAVGVTCH